MQLINCNAVNCSHNKDMICYSNRINVVGKDSTKDSDTACGSFLDSKAFGSLTNNIYDEGNACSCLVCDVESCKYNENELCSLDSIHVSGCGANLYSETSCESFCKK